MSFNATNNQSQLNKACDYTDWNSRMITSLKALGCPHVAQHLIDNIDPYANDNTPKYDTGVKVYRKHMSAEQLRRLSPEDSQLPGLALNTQVPPANSGCNYQDESFHYRYTIFPRYNSPSGKQLYDCELKQYLHDRNNFLHVEKPKAWALIVSNVDPFILKEATLPTHEWNNMLVNNDYIALLNKLETIVTGGGKHALAQYIMRMVSLSLDVSCNQDHVVFFNAFNQIVISLNKVTIPPTTNILNLFINIMFSTKMAKSTVPVIQSIMTEQLSKNHFEDPQVLQTNIMQTAVCQH